MSLNIGSSGKQVPKIWIKKILLALIGTAFTSCGMAFNSAACLGNDPVAVFYDGIRNTAHLSSGQLGIATNIINYSLMVLVFLISRKYVNIGTFLYTLPMGNFIDWSTMLYNKLGIPHTLGWQIFSSCCGCLMLYLGISMFISLNVGVDPITGTIMIIKDHSHLSYKTIKVIADLVTLVAGILLGGKFGVVTVVSAFIAGPLIQWLSGLHTKHLLVWFRLAQNNEY